MNEYDSNLQNYDSEMISKLGKLSERKQKIFQDLTKNPMLKNFLTKENISSKDFLETFEEYITPKHLLGADQSGEKHEDSENEEEKVQELQSIKKKYTLENINHPTGITSLLELKKKILKFSVNNKNNFNNFCMVNTNQIPFEYLTDIFENLYKEEIKMFAIMKIKKIIQPDLNERMRAFIVNWLMQVHYRFKLRHETLFLAIHIMDQFISFRQIRRTRLQIVAVTCLLIACKYEEIFSPEIRDFVCILDKQCEIEDILATEVEILKVLKFEVTLPSLLRYFEILSIAFDLGKEANLYGKYLIEVSLLYWRMSNRLNCLIASSICFMVLRIFYQDEIDGNDKIEHFFSLVNFKPCEIEGCVIEICFLLDNIENSNFQSVRRKYLSKEYLEIANEFP